MAHQNQEPSIPFPGGYLMHLDARRRHSLVALKLSVCSAEIQENSVPLADACKISDGIGLIFADHSWMESWIFKIRILVSCGQSVPRIIRAIVSHIRNIRIPKQKYPFPASLRHYCTTGSLFLSQDRRNSCQTSKLEMAFRACNSRKNTTTFWCNRPTEL